MSCDELISSCEQVRKMAERIRVEMQHSSLMTQDIDHLFNDLTASIAYCLKNAQQKQQRAAQSSASFGQSEGLNASPGTASMAAEGESRGIAQHGFANHYVGA